MIYWLFILWMPFVYGTETIHQSPEEGFRSHVQDSGSQDIQKISASPLISLEPKISLSLSEENRQFLFSSKRLDAEYSRNLKILRSHSFPWTSFLLILVVLILSSLFFKYRKKLFLKTDTKIQSQSLKNRTEHRIFELRKELAREGDLTGIYYELTKISREYLEEVFNKKMHVYSENEIENVVKGLPLSEDVKKILVSFLQESFYMKFADRRPTLDQVQKAMETINIIVKIN